MTLDDWACEQVKDPHVALAWLKEYLRRDNCDTDEEHKAFLARALILIGRAHGVSLLETTAPK